MGAFKLPIRRASGTRGLKPNADVCRVALFLYAALALFSAHVYATATSYTVGGSVSGLTSSGLKLTLNYAAPTCIGDGGIFTLKSTDTTDCFTPANFNKCCSQSIAMTATDGISTVTCTCGLITPNIATSISSASASTEVLNVPANATSYHFSTQLTQSQTYTVVVTQPPANPTQDCSVANASGTIASSNVTNVNVSCVTQLISGIRDLTLDPTFNSGAPAYADVTTTGHTDDYGVAVLPADNGNYWLIGSSTASDNSHRVPVVTEFAQNGAHVGQTLYAANTSLSSLVDISGAVKGVRAGVSRIYVVGTYQAGAFADDDFGVVCLSPADAFAACPGFGVGGLASFAFNRGGNNNDTPTAIAFDEASGDIFVTGYVEFPGNTQAGIVRLNGVSGAVASNWGNQTTPDGTFIYSANFFSGGSTYPLAIGVGVVRGTTSDVFIGGYGNVNASSSDTDGFVLAIDAAHGRVTDSGWNGGSAYRVAFNIGATYKIDVITTLAVRANGRLLIGGYVSGDSGVTQAIVGDFSTSGVPRQQFCVFAGLCLRTLGSQPIPTGIAERPDLGNVVISANTKSSTGIAIQSVYELDYRGAVVTAFGETSYSTATSPPDSRTSGILVDANNKVLQVGTRRWSSTNNDYDMTIRRWYRADSIFANGMGGAFAD